MREKHQLVASNTHSDQGLNPGPKYMPWPWIELESSQFMGQCSIHPTEPHWQGRPNGFEDTLSYFKFLLILEYIPRLSVLFLWSVCLFRSHCLSILVEVFIVCYNVWLGFSVLTNLLCLFFWYELECQWLAP